MPLPGRSLVQAPGANMAVAAMIGLVEPQLFKENLVTPAVIVGAGTVIREVIYLFVIWSFWGRHRLG